jgi:hypothetical protein
MGTLRSWMYEAEGMYLFTRSAIVSVSGYLMFAETFSVWIVDSSTTDHIARNRMVLKTSRWFIVDSKRIEIGNNSSVEVLRIGTSKFVFHRGHTLLLPDVLYAPDVMYSWISVLVLVKLSLLIEFLDGYVNLYRGTELLGNGYLSDGFRVFYIVRFSPPS